MLDRFQIDVRQVLDRCQIDVRQILDRCQIDFRQILDRFQIDVRQISDRFSIDFRQISDRCQIHFRYIAPIMWIYGRPLKKRSKFAKVVEIASKQYKNGLGVFKMAESDEKRCFTFFAFLPPYIGVSGSPMFLKRWTSTRSIDWYRRFLISCHLARD